MHPEEARRRQKPPRTRTQEERAADPTFDKVREALDRFHEHDGTFDAMIESIVHQDNKTSDAIASKWFREQEALELAVGEEFVKVTPNSADKAKLVGIAFAEKCSGYVRA